MSKEMKARQAYPVVLFIFFTTSLVESLVVSHLNAFLPVYLHQDLSVSQKNVPIFLALSTAIEFVLGLPLVPFWGVWADKFSRKWVIARSAYVEALVFFMIGASHSVVMFVISLLFVGFQLGNTGVMLSSIRDVAPAKRTGFAIAIFGLASPLGFALGPLMGSFLVEHTGLGLHGLFLLDGVLSAGSGVLVSVLFREVRPAAPPEGRTLDLALRAVRRVFTSPRIGKLFLIFGLVILGRQMVSPFIPLLVIHLHPLSYGQLSAIGLVTGTSALAGAAISPLAGILGDRIGFRRVLFVSVIVMAASFFAMAIAPSVLALAGLSLLFSAANSINFAMIFSMLATTLRDDERTPALNLVYVPLYISGIIGPIIAGGFARVDFPLVFIAAGVMALIGAWVVYQTRARTAVTTL
ncbi:hypothetical protein AYJ22_01805 [Ferroacidibacillus organovorans]|nr:hypothetical protein AYJ22_01805 [Ferroacidibacillus organovorans]